MSETSGRISVRVDCRWLPMGVSDCLLEARPQFPDYAAAHVPTDRGLVEAKASSVKLGDNRRDVEPDHGKTWDCLVD